jgi:WD40 repeat protein
LASASADGTIHIWDVAAGQIREVLRGHAGRVWSVAYSPDGKRLASSGTDGAIWLWDTDAIAGRSPLLQTQGFVTAVAFSPDGKLLATGGAALHLIDVAGHEVRTVPVYDNVALSFSPDGRTLAYADGMNVGLLDVDTLQVLRYKKCHDERIISLTFSHDGQWLATGSIKDGMVKTWDRDLSSKRSEMKALADSVHSLPMAPGGKLFAICGNEDDVLLWRPQEGSAMTRLRGHFQGVSCGVFTPDGKTLATGSADRTVRLWDVPSGRARAVLPGHTAPVFCLAITPDGRILATGSQDHTIRLWDLESNQQIAVLTGHRYSVRALAFSRDGRSLVSGSSRDPDPGGWLDEGELFNWNPEGRRLAPTP